MKFTTSEEYGLRCLLHIARHCPVKSVTIGEISQAERLSTHNVAKILRILRKAGLVTSVRGQSGGYVLARPAHEITIGEVLDKVGGKLFDPSFCDRHSGIDHLCVHTTLCSIRALLRGLQGVVDDFLTKVTLADLLGREREVHSKMDHATIEPLNS